MRVSLRRACALAGLLLPLTLVPCGAGAQQDEASAAALFESGVREMKAGNFSVGCPAIEESQKISPRPGTLFTLAECNARWGRFATAHVLFDDYLREVERLPLPQQLPHRDRQKLAAARRAELAPRVPTLTLVLPAGAPAGTEVTRDGQLQGGPALGLPLPVDPGAHLVTTRAPGGPPHEHRFELAPGEQRSLSLLVDPAAPAAPAPAASLLKLAASSGAARPPAPRPGPPGAGARRPLGYAAGAAGAAFVAIGAVTGLLAIGRKHTVDQNCQDTDCNHAGKVAADSMKTLGLVSTVSFGVGAAGLVASALLLLSGPADPGAARAAGPRWQAALGPRDAALRLGGDF